MPDRITFDKNINESVQVGDKLYYCTITPGSCSIRPSNNNTELLCIDAGGTWTPPVVGTRTEIGDITAIGEKYVEVASVGSATVGDFFMFRKPEHNNYTNVSSLKGYFAEVQFTNNSSVKQELFAVGSEVTVSSK